MEDKLDITVEELKQNWEGLSSELVGIIGSVARIFELLNKILPAEDKILLESKEIMKRSTKTMEKVLEKFKSKNKEIEDRRVS